MIEVILVCSEEGCNKGNVDVVIAGVIGRRRDVCNIN